MATGRTKIVVLLTAVMTCGCVQRTITITSDPPGALVWMNNQEIGRTPLTRDFLWYGTYDVQLRKEGCQTLKTRTKVIAAWWQWPPIDLLAEICPWRPKDRRTISYTLAPASTQPPDPQELFVRAEELRAQLESSRYTRQPTTMPAR